MKPIKTTLIVLGVLSYVGLGIAQFFAIMEGLGTWLGVPWVISLVITFFLAYMPIIGTVTGIMGAIKGWGWTYPGAILFFCWPYGLALVVTALVLIADYAKSRNHSFLVKCLENLAAIAFLILASMAVRFFWR
jgi:hypothetical protein